MNDLTLHHSYRGKVRDLYDVDDDSMLMVASDRLSAFDVVMAEPIPNKGRVLTAFTDYWVRAFPDVRSSQLSCDPVAIEAAVPGFADQTEWHGRTMWVRRAQMLPLECVVRARLAGQAYEEYVARGTVGGVPLAAGLRLADELPEVMFTPSTKEEVGHDRYLDRAEAANIVGEALLAQAASICLELFSRAATRLARADLVLADTKFELGFVDGELVLCDEVITPDSSRIWPAGAITPGSPPPAFDKQPFRDWLATLPWDRTPPPPPVPVEIVATTSDRYVAAYENVTGLALADWYGRTA